MKEIESFTCDFMSLLKTFIVGPYFIWMKHYLLKTSVS